MASRSACLLFFSFSLLLFVSFAFSSASAKPLGPKLWTPEAQSQFELLTDYVRKAELASNKFGLKATNLECGLCAIVINEIEGFIAENLTESEMQVLLTKDICSKLGGVAETICDGVVKFVPTVISSFESFATVSQVCVDLSLCAAPLTNHADPVAAPLYTIDLDLPPSQRWQEICSVPDYQQQMQSFVKSITDLLPNQGKDLQELGNSLNLHYFPSEMAQEISGCAQYLGVPTGWLSIINLGYEISDACTSIVAQTTNGTIYHARNLDFWTGIWLTDTLRNMTFQAEYMRGGKLAFHATTFAGFVGSLSGQVPFGFSVTIDTRFYPKSQGGIAQFFYEIIAAIEERNASLVTFLSRAVLANEFNFNSALVNLSNDELIADVYYILAGVSADQGAVISRNRFNATDVWILDSPSRWFEVQTNYDHWTKAPWFDDRVTPANQGMNRMGQEKLTIQGMFDVLSTKPVFNIQTTYSILSIPATGFYQSFARYCPYPCSE